MLADVICHAWFCRNTKFHEVEQKEELMDRVTNKGYTFSVIEHGSTNAVERLMAEGAYGEALFEACLYISQPENSNQVQLQRLYELVATMVESLVSLPGDGRNLHLNTFKGRLNYIITVDRNYDRALALLDLTKRSIITPLKGKLPETETNSVNLLAMETLTAEIEVANHRGSTGKAEKTMQQIKEIIPSLARRWENFQYIIEFLFREAVHLHNCYDFDGAIKLMDELEKFYDETIELYPVALPQVFDEPIKSDMKGKILGNRLQAYMFEGRQDPACYDLARQDSQQALEEFEHFHDRSRHYIYRCQIETDSGHLESAMKYLAMGVSQDKIQPVPREICAVISSDTTGSLVFGLMHYARIMAAAIKTSDKRLAGEMEQEWNKCRLDDYTPIKEGYNDHPVEIINWKKGTYYLYSGSIKAGLEWHRRALDICFRDPENNTLHTIGLGILAEQAGLMAGAGGKYKSDFKHAIKQARSKCDNMFSQPDLPKAMVYYFADWPVLLEQIMKDGEIKEAGEKLLKLAEMVPY